MVYIMSSKKGFTLAEVICASAILIFVVAAAFSTYIILSQYVRDITTQSGLQSQTRITVEQMAREIRLASIVAIGGGGNTITLTFNPNKLGGVVRPASQYTLVGNQIRYIPDITLPGQFTTVMDKVDLNLGDRLFQYSGGTNVVTIDARVSNIALTNIEQNAHLTTSIQLRN